MPNTCKYYDQWIVCSTSFAGIFFGKVKEYIAVPGVGATITLTEARQCLYWEEVVGGYVGLAVIGPSKGSKLGTIVAEITLHTVTSDMPATRQAIAAWK